MRGPVSLEQEFTRLQSLSHEEQQKQLRDLAVRGEIIAAIYIARKLYGFRMLQAKTMVDGLTNGQQPTWLWVPRRERGASVLARGDFTSVRQQPPSHSN